MTRAFVDDRRPGWSPYSQVGTAFKVLCSDGKVRTAVATADADSFYTIPSRVSVRGRTVTGSVYSRGNLDETGPLYRFTAYSYRRNADALPEWPVRS